MRSEVCGSSCAIITDRVSLSEAWGVRGSQRCIEQCDRFVHQFAAAHNPIERVFQNARHAVRVFRAANQDAISALQFFAPFNHGARWRIGIEIGIEMGKFRPICRIT